MANANSIITDNMSLQEKLDAIDAAMRAAQEQANDEASSRGDFAAPIDPQDFLMCEGCQ